MLTSMWINHIFYTLLVEMYNRATAVEYRIVVPLKIKHRIIIWSRNSTSRYIPQIIESRDWRYLYANIHSSIVHSSQNVETTQMTTDWWINKMWHTYTMKHYSALKSNQVLIQVIIWINFNNIMLAVRKTQKGRYFMILFIKDI